MTAPLLTDEEIDQLTDDELQAYVAALEQVEGEWVLSDKQQRAEDLSATVDELMYGGAAGGGKTEWMLWHAYQLCLQYPKHKVLALRRTFPQLKRSLIERSLEKFDPEQARYMVGDKEWVFHNGSKITFGHLDLEEDVRHYLSAQYDLILFEELTEFTEKQYRLLVSRCRTTAAQRNRGVRPHVIAATNPGQVGHAWVKAYFVDATAHGEKFARHEVQFEGQVRERLIAFVPAQVKDNPHIDPDYVFNLAQLGEVEQRQYLYGDWDVFEGQFFGDFKREVHVIKPFIIPASWPRFRAIDFGMAAPYCCLWFTVDFDGNLVVYRELYEKGRTAAEQARAILEVSTMANGKREEIAYTVADPSVWARTGTGQSIVMMYRDNGLMCRKAMNARRDGWSRTRDFLRGDGTAGGHPYVRIFDTCTNLIRTLPGLVHDKVHPEDLDTHGEDHAADAFRYGLMSRPRAPKRKLYTDETRLADDIERAVRDKSRGPAHEVLGRL